MPLSFMDVEMLADTGVGSRLRCEMTSCVASARCRSLRRRAALPLLVPVYRIHHTNRGRQYYRGRRIWNHCFGLDRDPCLVEALTGDGRHTNSSQAPSYVPIGRWLSHYEARMKGYGWFVVELGVNARDLRHDLDKYCKGGRIHRFKEERQC
jgi:hypothetical protein